MRVGAFDDLNLPRSCRRDRLTHLRVLIARVGEDDANEREARPRLAQNLARPVAVLHIGRMHGDAQQKPERVDGDVALAPDELLARVEPRRVQPRAPF